MFDFPFSEPTFFTALFAFCSYLFIYTKGYNIFVKNSQSIYVNRQFTPIVIFLFYILISIHCINGDFFHLMESIHKYNLTDISQNHQEPIYTIIARLWNRNYLLFRLTVWGIAIICMKKMYHKLNINFHLGFWIFLVCYAILFAYARASAAMAIYFWGLTLLINKNKSIICKIVGVGIIMLSYEFHHSMLILIILTPLSFFPLNKSIFFITISALPLIVIIVRLVFSGVLDDLSIFDDEYLQKKMQNYSERDFDGTSLRTQIMDGIKYSSVYIPFIVSAYYIIIKKASNYITKVHYRLFVYTFWLFVVTTAVSYLNLEVNTFFYRMLYMTMIPTIALFVCLIQKGIISKTHAMKIIFIAMTSQILNYLYMLYLNVV